ncbi:MAG: inorganic phosphate transporter, partial [Phycisphaerae bacterium]
LAALALLRTGNLEIGTKVDIESWQLLVCGLLLFVGMTTKNAARVTKAEVSTGSMGDHVALWAPNWCVVVARRLLRFRHRGPALAPRAEITTAGKTVHYDTLRACVIMSVSASVIATASSLKLPVSTTYVAFAAVVATGLADRIFQRGDAELKLGRTVWVVTSWVLSAVVAAAAAACVAFAVLHLHEVGMGLCLVINLIVRRTLKKRADRQARRVEEEAYERAHPEEFALEREDE